MGGAPIELISIGEGRSPCKKTTKGMCSTFAIMSCASPTAASVEANEAA